MRKLINTLIVSLLLLSVSSSYGQKAQVKTSIDTTRILIGDQINILFELEADAHDQVQFPIFRDTLVSNVEVLSVSPIDSQPLEDGLKKLMQRVLITSFDTGFYVIPSFDFYNSTQNDSMRSEALPLEVVTLEIDTTKGIADIKLPYDVPLTFWDIFPYILVGLLLAGVAFGLWYILKKRKEKPVEIIKPKPSEPPHVWALKELDRLASQKLWQQGKIKLFHSRVSEIIRGYIEYRFEIPAMERTTSEIIFAFDEIDFDNRDLLEKLHQSMEISDLVKFAKWNPKPEENETAIEMAYEFVYKTKKIVNLRESSEEKNEEAQVKEDRDAQ